MKIENLEASLSFWGAVLSGIGAVIAFTEPDSQIPWIFYAIAIVLMIYPAAGIIKRYLRKK